MSIEYGYVKNTRPGVVVMEKAQLAFVLEGMKVLSSEGFMKYDPTMQVIEVSKELLAEAMPYIPSLSKLFQALV